MLARLLVATCCLLALPATAHAKLQLAIQDQGADPQVLDQIASELDARTVRFVVRPGEPHLDQIRQARATGRRVQVAIMLKRGDTAGDVRWLLRQWDGLVSTVSIGNEPDLLAIPACDYARVYRQAYSLIRREFPGTQIGFLEGSPHGGIDYAVRVLACPGPRLRADFLAVHPYQFWSDPLAKPSMERAAGGLTWVGLGNLSLVRAWLDHRATTRRLSTPHGRPVPIRCTEFSYLVTGRYATTPERAAWLWPRAIKQAAKWCEQLVVYGLGQVPATSAWGSAALLDGDGAPTAALRAIIAAK